MPERPAATGAPRRADALRNRDRLLDAADAVFAAQGPSGSTEEIARRAGVGIGTLFRHYASKEALLEAVLARRLDRLAEEVQALADNEYANDAFFVAFNRAIAEAPAKLALTDALAGGGMQSGDGVVGARARLRQAFTLLLRRAQEAGAVRADLGVDEVFALLVGASRTAAEAPFKRDVIERALAVILDGLRPTRERSSGAAARSRSTRSMKESGARDVQALHKPA
jgi:AcrR family transcriptional regulator